MLPVFRCRSHWRVQHGPGIPVSIPTLDLATGRGLLIDPDRIASLADAGARQTKSPKISATFCAMSGRPSGNRRRPPIVRDRFWPSSEHDRPNSSGRLVFRIIPSSVRFNNLGSGGAEQITLCGVSFRGFRLSRGLRWAGPGDTIGLDPARVLARVSAILARHYVGIGH